MPSTTPVLLLPPFPFDSRVFAPLRAALGRQRPVLTPDPVLDGAPTLDTVADRAVAELDAHGVDRAVVGGVSMGGYVALNLVRRHPDRLAGVVLMDTRATADTADARAQRWAVADRADRGERPERRATVAGMVSPLTRSYRPTVVRFLEDVVADQSAASVAWRQRAMAARPDSTAALAAVAVPVLVIVGSDDALTPPTLAAQMAACARQSTLREIPGTGHLAVAEDPAAVATAMAAWWEGWA
ncbi:alpha/beta fold hydrolase [Nakamurella deserti]|uniref:alpha/beta fold hydrolase n=1 Tax=Nakamurella deserti TaxID=2164074 RepID=UPI000DBE3965|nr:alpha/beta hydrolase [Nakamurella deserti]